ncbi:MAG: cyclic pyranopterin monophosphate synthase MoaC [Johnsonella sp.]|nr:cyclic pyranopterin monophosphate synthase MoaC [Johnsonella sp.]
MDEEKKEVLNHFDAQGRAHMVDIGAKKDTERIAVAQGCISMKKEAYVLMRSGKAEKGDVLGIARIAGIMAAKKTSGLIPLCHNILLNHVSTEFDFDDARCRTKVRAKVKSAGKTGVEMEALTAVTVSLLTIYDMCKSMDKGMHISDIELVRKEGGKSGAYENEGLHQ